MHPFSAELCFESHLFSFDGIENAVRVWSFDIGPVAQARVFSRGTNERDALAPWAADCLSKEERVRALRLKFTEHARRFIVFHATKRLLLAQELQCEPHALPFSWLQSGKPVLGISCTDRQWPSISLSHSGDVGVLALSEIGGVGVDVERVRAVRNMQSIVESRFDKAMSAQLSALDGDTAAQQELFFRLWTAREARFKCTGSYVEKQDEQIRYWRRDCFAYAVMCIVMPV